MADSNDPHPKVPATPARQGALGKPVLAILVVSVTLAFLGLLGSWLLRSDDLAETAPHAAQQPSDAAVCDEPEPSPIEPTMADKRQEQVPTPANPTRPDAP